MITSSVSGFFDISTPPLRPMAIIKYMARPLAKASGTDICERSNAAPMPSAKNKMIGESSVEIATSKISPFAMQDNYRGYSLKQPLG